jgi:hypothetical protein
MSAPISDVVDVVVSTQGTTVQSQGFGKALALATHLHFTDRDREYGAAADMASDGFATTEAPYLAAVAYFSQNPAPLKLKIGRRHVDAGTVTVDTAVDTTAYTLTISGVAYTFTSGSSATAAQIATGLRAAINADSACPVAATGASAAVILTTKVSGTAWSLLITGVRMSLGALTAAETIGAALDAILLADTDFYGVILASDRASADMQAAATWVSANKRLLFAMTAEANVIGVAVGSDTTTLPAILKAAAYDRVITLYHASGATNFIDAAAAGWVLARNPGSYTFALKTLIGIAVSSLTPTQRANAAAKYAITYETRGGVNQTASGKVASGKNVDQIHGRDWLASTIQTNIFALLASVDKVPFTDDGIGQVEQVTKQAGALGVARTYLASYSTLFPLVSAISSVDKAARLLSGGKMTALEAGAIEKVTFNLIVQV